MICFLLILLILENLYFPSVLIGICHDIHDLELKPLLINSPEIKAQDTCSPDETKTSYSESEKFLLIFLYNIYHSWDLSAYILNGDIHA